MQIDKDKFLTLYQNQYSTLKDSQKNGLIQLLTFIENDSHITDVRWVAYILATIKHECGNVWLPIHENGTKDYFVSRYGSDTRVGKVLGNKTSDDGWIYAGVGYVQVTGRNNAVTLNNILPKEYPEVIAKWEAANNKKFSLMGTDFQNLKDPELSYCAASIGMRKGLFTGKALSNYINDTTCDYLHARKIINGMDRAVLIKDYAVNINEFLKG